MSVRAGSDVFGSLTITLPLLSSIAIRPFAFSTASVKRSSSVTINCFNKSLLILTHGHSSIPLFLTLLLGYIRGTSLGRSACERGQGQHCYSRVSKITHEVVVRSR